MLGLFETVEGDDCDMARVKILIEMCETFLQEPKYSIVFANEAFYNAVIKQCESVDDVPMFAQSNITERMRKAFGKPQEIEVQKKESEEIGHAEVENQQRAASPEWEEEECDE
jgi:hypothetical protein